MRMLGAQGKTQAVLKHLPPRGCGDFVCGPERVWNILAPWQDCLAKLGTLVLSVAEQQH